MPGRTRPMHEPAQVQLRARQQDAQRCQRGAPATLWPVALTGFVRRGVSVLHKRACMIYIAITLTPPRHDRAQQPTGEQI